MKKAIIYTIRYISIWSISGHCYHYIQAHVSSINQITINQAQDRLASVSYDKALTLWEITPEMCLKQLWTSRPLLDCANARFSLFGKLEPVQKVLIEEQGGFIAEKEINPPNNASKPLQPLNIKNNTNFFNHLNGAVNNTKEMLSNFKAEKIHYFFKHNPEITLDYRWDEEIYSSSLLQLNSLLGLEFRSYPRISDNMIADAILRVECFSVMEIIVKQIKSLDIPHKVLMDKKSYYCIVIPDVNHLELNLLSSTHEMLGNYKINYNKA